MLSEPPEPEPSAATRGDRQAILLCDEDGTVLQALSRMLSDLGHDVTLACTVNEAWKHWQNAAERFDAVITTDVHIGADRGTELVRRVLDDRAGTRVVLMSGDSQSFDIHDPVWTRAARLQKPFTRSALCAALSGAQSNTSSPKRGA